MKRRIRRIRRALKRAGLYNAFHITLIAVLLTGFCVILFNVKEPEQQEKEPEEVQAEVTQNPETMTQTAESIEGKYKVYEFDKTGDSGQSKGYMQIYEKWHTDRMQNLGCTDLMNPYQNVRVGIDFLSYLLKKYGTIQDTLAAYNYGEKGAREYLWSNGVYVYSYNTAIMQRMKEIEEVVGK